MLRAITVGVRRLMARRIVDRELDDEVQQFLEAATEAHMKAGLSRQAAERAARVDFGGVENVKDQLRSTGWDAGLSTLWQDVRFGLRMLRRNPAFTAVALATIVIGIGANTAMFSVVRAVMLRPLPYARPEQLALLWSDDPARGLHEGATAYRTVLDWRSASHTFTDLAIFSSTTATLPEEPRERVIATFVSANLFPLLGAAPALGRVMTQREEDGRAPVAVLSHAFWQRRFGGDSGVIGKTMDLGERGKGGLPPSRIIGVMPPSFSFPDKQTQLWIPATLYWRWERERTERFQAWVRRWSVVGRLSPTASIAAAQRELNGIGDRLAAEYPSTVPDFPGFRPHVVSLLDQVIGPAFQSTLWLLFGAVGFVLVIACANVANLLLARGASRQHELATRRALGAGRGRLVRQLLVESLLLSVGGGALGVALAGTVTRMLAVTGASYLPRFDEVSVDAGVILFATLASLATGIAFGVVPALRATAVRPMAALQDNACTTGSRRRRRTSAVLVVVECALAVVLLIGAGLLLRSLARLNDVDPGFRTTNVLSARVVVPPPRPPTRAEARGGPNAEAMIARQHEEMFRALLDRIAAAPGIQGAVFADDILIRGEADESITIPDRPDAPAGQLYTSSMSPELFAVLSVPLRAGRHLTRADVATKIRALWGGLPDRRLSLAEQARVSIAEPVVVNEAFVRRFFAGENAVGKRFCIDPTGKTYWYEIVGVVGDMRRQTLERDPVPEYFQTFVPRTTAELLVRTRGDPMASALTIRRLVRDAIPGIIVLDVSTLEQRMGALTFPRRFQTWLLALFAALALVLSAIGIYGIVYYAVAERRREIGVRIALGASQRDVFADVVVRGMSLPIAGIAIGLVAAAWLTRLMTSLVFGIGTADPVAIGATIGALASVAFLACYLPARRAARIDPIIALRDY